MDNALLDILCCPVTQQPLEPMKASSLRLLNQRITRGEVTDGEGRSVTETWSAALITRDGRLAYPITDDIPVLLEGHSVQIAEGDETTRG